VAFIVGIRFDSVSVCEMVFDDLMNAKTNKFYMDVRE
jgi:hypothetical protein